MAVDHDCLLSDAVETRDVHFGTNNSEQEVLLDEVDCNGNESRLLDCPSQALGNTDCGRFEAAGVICHGNER